MRRLKGIRKLIPDWRSLESHCQRRNGRTWSTSSKRLGSFWRGYRSNTGSRWHHQSTLKHMKESIINNSDYQNPARPAQVHEQVWWHTRLCLDLQTRRRDRYFPSTWIMIRHDFTRKCGLVWGTHSAVYATEVPLKNISPRETEKWNWCGLLVNWMEMWSRLSSRQPCKRRKVKTISNHFKIKSNEKILFMVTVLMLAVAPSQKAQWIWFTDPAIWLQVATVSNEIVQTSNTVSNVVKNFKEVEKVYKRAKSVMILSYKL